MVAGMAKQPKIQSGNDTRDLDLLLLLGGAFECRVQNGLPVTTVVCSWGGMKLYCGCHTSDV